MPTNEDQIGASPHVTDSQNQNPTADNVNDDIFSTVVFGQGTEQDDPFAANPPTGAGEPTNGTPAPQPVQQPPTQAQPPNGQQPAQPPQLPPEVVERLRQAEHVLPLVRFIQENPDVTEYIERKLSNAPAPAPDVKPPEPPVRPASYNPVDAMQNPESESWKYRESLEDYRTKHVEYLTGELQREKESARQAAARAEAQSKERARVMAVANEVVAKHGLTPAQATDFVRVMSDPRSVQIPYLVQLYKIIRGQQLNAQGAQPQQPSGGPPPPNGAAQPPGNPAQIDENWATAMAQNWVKKPGA